MSNLSIRKAIAAGRTLEILGYTYHDGELWKPPLGANPFTPATADDVTPKMMVECNNNLASDISTAEFVAAVNAYLGAKK